MNKATLTATIVLLSACGGSSSSPPAPATRTTTPSTRVAADADLRGVVSDPPEGTIAFLVEKEHGGDLFEQARAIVTSTEIGADGRFAFTGVAAGEWEVLVSAPGRALTCAPLAADTQAELELAPEAKARITITRSGVPDEDAVALVLDGDRILPLPPTDLVSGADGLLLLTRLPAGRYELLVASGDGSLHGALGFTASAGHTTPLRVELARDDELRDRFLRTVGGPGVGPLEEVTR